MLRTFHTEGSQPLAATIAAAAQSTFSPHDHVAPIYLHTTPDASLPLPPLSRAPASLAQEPSSVQPSMVWLNGRRLVTQAARSPFADFFAGKGSARVPPGPRVHVYCRLAGQIREGEGGGAW